FLNYAIPEVCYIEGREVTCNNVTDKNSMFSISGRKVHEKVNSPGDNISGPTPKIWSFGLVGDVTIEVSKIEGSNVWLTIVLAERSRLTAYYFTGVNRTQESSLKDDIDLIRGRIVTDAMIRSTELAVRKFFVKKGYL